MGTVKPLFVAPVRTSMNILLLHIFRYSANNDIIKNLKTQ